MRRRKERGFALLIIVMLTALLALTAATLLDLVSVDLQIAGEHRKVVKAQMVADGAIREIIADRYTDNLLPDFASPSLRYVWAVDAGGGNFRKNPGNVPGEPDVDGTLPYGAINLDEATSVVAQSTGIPQRQDNYEATIDFLRYGVGVDTGISNKIYPFYYEVRARAQVNGGDANHELSATIYKKFQVAAGTIPPRFHRR